MASTTAHSAPPTCSASGKESAAPMHMRKTLLLAAALGLFACSSQVQPPKLWPKPAPLTVVVPPTILLHGDRLADAKRALLAGDEELTASFVALLDSALVAYNAEPLSVM